MTDYPDTSRAQFEVFKSLPRDTPVNMLNLVQFHSTAKYPAGHELAAKALTGAQAYANYGAASGPILARVGGTVIWRGGFEMTLIGAPDEAWDAMFIVHFPAASAFLAMVTDPQYQLAVVHRQAAVKTSRLIRTTPQPASDIFG
ncbi:DUF1330 domain-containing protein [Sulfitobacter guttiformis]|uniref:Uncharacterized protein (DUF1330 family) n=1 Tax=Sulfitobacter guttiformis TaxID=74349 RepID=A0A420DQ30_9RHOB|nr:DUF1330 domain-containing protein [Sulfitobacter guttiformis]KIN73622.1 hypothetical protein Z949_2814 [Sulfitobacter guttiformis KCTC 32187]RKE96269.1 uncharacterized protein (DUF1330 family) [Sulfitobacter guttiformis]